MEYPKREALEKKLFGNFERKVSEKFGSEKKSKDIREIIRKIYLEPQDGCLPDEFVGEDLLCSIQSKFYEFFISITQALEKDLLEPQGVGRTWISIWIDPSYDDETYVIVTFQSVVLLLYGRKAWNFSWPSVGDLKKEMTDIYYGMRDKLNTYFWEGIRYERNKN